VEELGARAEAAQAFLRDREHLRVAIQADQEPIGTESREDRRGVSAVAGGRVDDVRVGPRRQQLEHFGDHHRLMRRLHRVAPRRKREFSASFSCVFAISAS
jgi:hypothetical protein